MTRAPAERMCAMVCNVVGRAEGEDRKIPVDEFQRTMHDFGCGKSFSVESRGFLELESGFLRDGKGRPAANDIKRAGARQQFLSGLPIDAEGLLQSPREIIHRPMQAGITSPASDEFRGKGNGRYECLGGSGALLLAGMKRQADVRFPSQWGGLLVRHGYRKNTGPAGMCLEGKNVRALPRLRDGDQHRVLELQLCPINRYDGGADR